MGELSQRILTVSQLTSLVRDRLEQQFSDVWVEGEISNLRTPSSGHLYFTLKDPHAQMRAVLFRSAAERLKFALREGLLVIVRGRLSVYEPRGEYQVVLEYLEPKGIGALQIAFEQLKEKLEREGLFDPSRKRPLPFFPRAVGLVTSPTGAAIRDMLHVLHRRCPILSVVIYPVAVQGAEAAPQIADAIRALSQSGRVDVMIVGRGGGSWEDLWCFNEEVVVRAVAGSTVPVVSAVGHQIDYTLADFAADYRAPTPSAAAEAVAPVLEDVVQALREYAQRQVRALTTRLVLSRQQIDVRTGALTTLPLHIQRLAQRLDDAADRLGWTLNSRLSKSRQRAVTCQQRLATSSPVARVRGASVLVPQLLKRLEQRMLALVVMRRQMVRSVVSALDTLSPLAILARGYSIVHRVSDGRVVRRAQDVKEGQAVRARLSEGYLLCDVREAISDQ
ncbi:MAG: exodeoxyribonuclease VII large subunit [Nitrospiraceae bacterium]